MQGSGYGSFVTVVQTTPTVMMIYVSNCIVRLLFGMLQVIYVPFIEVKPYKYTLLQATCLQLITMGNTDPTPLRFGLAIISLC